MNNIGDVAAMGLCTGCGACIQACPFGELTFDNTAFGSPAPLKHENCNNCGACVRECPPYQWQYDDD